MKKLLLLYLSVMLICFWQLSKGVRSNTNSEGQGDNQSSEKKTQKAVIISKPAPKYPLEERGHNATVYVRMVFRSTGKVADIEVIKVSPYNLPEDATKAFVRESLKVANQIKFVPAMKEGRPASQYVQVEYHFDP